MSVIDLTQLLIANADGPDTPQSDHSISKVRADISVVFRDHQRRLLDLIDRYPYVLGCVAWLTDMRVLDALSSRDGVSIIVQKEDFLRPDMTDRSDFEEMLRRAYGRIGGICRYEAPGVASGLSVCCDPEMDAVRCVGNYNSEKHPAWPRMHNKFIVLCSYKESPNPDIYGGELHPECVWTGSYNFTFNAQKSFENSIIIHDRDIAEAYAHEWAQILAFSEPLDWESRWCAPEYRIGT